MSASSYRPLSPDPIEVHELRPVSPSSSSSSGIGQGTDEVRVAMKRSQALGLYTSHLLSTWNARTYEFAAIIFTASVYPDTLVANSIRGITATLATIAFSSSIGRWIDRAPNRLETLLTTITVNRVSVLAACGLWTLIVQNGASSTPDEWKAPVFSAVLVLGVLEKLSSAANMISMERDWIVTAAAPDGHVYDLTKLNAVMRRIDLSCKLVSPILISLVISASSAKVGVLTVGGMSATSWVIEWWCARKAWNENANLQSPKTGVLSQVDSTSTETISFRIPVASDIIKILALTTRWLQKYAYDFADYFSCRAWRPSFALAILHISVLSYSATFITYLLNAGFSLNTITLARALGSVVEIGSTLVTPIGVSYLGKAHHHRGADDQEEGLLEGQMEEARGNTETGLERLGLWGINWQLLNLVPVVLALWALSPSPTPAFLQILSRITDTGFSLSRPLLAFILFIFLSTSRLGLWTFDLTTQQLSQILVPSTQRSSFAGVESSLVAVFELFHHIFTILLSKPAQFRYLATGSLAMVAVSAMIYGGWVRRQRGHLVHWEKMGIGIGCGAKRRS